MEPLKTGLRGHEEFIVRASDSARAFRSGSLDVLATPVLIGAAEETCADLVQPQGLARQRRKGERRAENLSAACAETAVNRNHGGKGGRNVMAQRF